MSPFCTADGRYQKATAIPWLLVMMTTMTMMMVMVSKQHGEAERETTRAETGAHAAALAHSARARAWMVKAVGLLARGSVCCECGPR